MPDAPAPDDLLSPDPTPADRRYQDATLLARILLHSESRRNQLEVPAETRLTVQPCKRSETHETRSLK